MQPARYVPQSQQGYAQQQAYAQPAYPQPSYPEPSYMPPQDYGRGGYAPQPRPAVQPRQPEPDFDPEPDFAEEPPPPLPRPRSEPVKAAPAPKPAPKPVPPPPVEDLPSDDELDSMLGSNSSDRDDAGSRMFGGSAASRAEPEANDEDKIAKLPDPEPLRPVYAGKVEDDDDLDDDIEPDEIPDPDPIPTVYGGADDDDLDEDDDFEEKSGGLRLLIAPAVTIVAIGAIVAGLVLAREPIVKLWPPANDYVYDLMGLHVMLPGEGLKRELTRTAMETIAEVDHVIATGLITNVSDKEQPLPQVVVQLIDANEKVLNSKVMTLEKASLAAGEVLQFKAVFDGAPATARKVRTEWGGFPAGPAPAAAH